MKSVKTFQVVRRIAISTKWYLVEADSGAKAIGRVRDGAMDNIVEVEDFDDEDSVIVVRTFSATDLKEAREQYWGWAASCDKE